MGVKFDELVEGNAYGRKYLAEYWGYKSFNAIGRGIVTPKDKKIIILFITKEKQASLEQYNDSFDGQNLLMDGETTHSNDQRLIDSLDNDQVNLFYREVHHSDFIYCGEVYLVGFSINDDIPSRFAFSRSKEKAISSNALRIEANANGVDLEGFEGDEEGRKRIVQHVRYERSTKNRRIAISVHGTKCRGCGFDFNAFYGSEHAKSYIEIHHIKSITKTRGRVNPELDLEPLCSNCHRMVHKRRGEILTIEELKALIEKAKRKNRAG